MTQKNLKEQLAEMQNNLIALDKIINTPSEKTVKKFLITYVDGTEQWFVPEVMPEALLETPPKYTTDEILAQLRKRATDLAKIKTADDPLVAKPLKPQRVYLCNKRCSLQLNHACKPSIKTLQASS